VNDLTVRHWVFVGLTKYPKKWKIFLMNRNTDLVSKEQPNNPLLKKHFVIKVIYTPPETCKESFQLSVSYLLGKTPSSIRKGFF